MLYMDQCTQNVNAGTDAIGTSTSHATGITTNIALITINTSSYTPMNSGSIDGGAVTLLRELGHAFNDVYGAGTTQIFNDDSSVPNSASVSAGNTAYIKAQCGL